MTPADIPMLIPLLLTSIPAVLGLTWYYRRRRNRPVRFEQAHLSKLRSAVLKKKAKKRQRLGLGEYDQAVGQFSESRSLLASANNERMRRRKEIDEQSLDIVDDLSSSDEDDFDSEDSDDAEAQNSDDSDEDSDADLENVHLIDDRKKRRRNNQVPDPLSVVDDKEVELELESILQSMNDEMKEQSQQANDDIIEEGIPINPAPRHPLALNKSGRLPRRNKIKPTFSQSTNQSNNPTIAPHINTESTSPILSSRNLSDSPSTANTVLPSIQSKHRSIYGILYFNVLEASLLTGTSAACFVVISHGTQVYRTQTSKKSSSPIINQKARIVIREREVAWPICVSLWAKRGKRRGGGVFCVGRCTMDVRRLMTGEGIEAIKIGLDDTTSTDARQHLAAAMNVDAENKAEGEWVVRNWWQMLAPDLNQPAPTQPVLTASTTRGNQAAWTDDEDDMMQQSAPLINQSNKNNQTHNNTHGSVRLHLESLYVPLPASTVGYRMWHDICSLYDVHDEGRVSSEQVQQLLTCIDGLQQSHQHRLAEICANGTASVQDVSQALARAEIEREKFIKQKKKQLKKRHSNPGQPSLQQSESSESTSSNHTSIAIAPSPTGETTSLALAELQSSNSTDHDDILPPISSLGERPVSEIEIHDEISGPPSTSSFLVEVPLSPSHSVLPVATEWTPVYLKRCPVCLVELTPSSSVDPRDCLIHVRFCLETLVSLSEDPCEIEEYATGGFLSEEYAVKSWASHMMHGETYGSDKLLQYLSSRAHFILVQDRATGQLKPEKVPFLVKLLFRFIYQSPFGRTAHNSVSFGLMQRMSEMMGRKYDGASSRSHIQAFITYYGIDMSQFMLSADKFTTFNEFFYRAIKPEMRPIAGGDDVIVSPADCRITVFPSVSEATRIWIKGSTFSLSSLLVEPSLVHAWPDCSLAIARLAPDDYHRFHLPLDCTIGSTIEYSGGYASVNPLAIRSAKNVLTQNKRVLTVLHPKQSELGDVLYIAVGATMVGSVHLTTHEGEVKRKGDEHGYFAFGGSTVLMLFKQGSVTFDEDLLYNTGKSMETLIRMGESIARVTPSTTHSTNPTIRPSNNQSINQTINPLCVNKLAESDGKTQSDNLGQVSINDLTKDQVDQLARITQAGDF